MEVEVLLSFSRYMNQRDHTISQAQYHRQKVLIQYIGNVFILDPFLSSNAGSRAAHEVPGYSY